MPEDALIINTLWRTSSTWWWTQFRENPHFTAYYEPLHQYMMTRTHAQCAESHNSKPKDKIFRHPKTAEHYFNEYPLRDEGGVAGFEKRFSLENFVLAENAKDKSLSNYIQSLINLAREKEQSPFFKFSRAPLRGAWIKKNFGGTHGYLLRDPAAMFESSYSFMLSRVRGGPADHFIASPVMIVAQNSAHPLFAPLASHLGLMPFHASTFQAEIDHFGHEANKLDLQAHRDISAFLWSTSLAHATRYADLFIDADLANDAAYRNRIAGELSQKTGKTIELRNDYALPAARTKLTVSNEAKKMIRDACDLLRPDWSRLKQGTLSQPSFDALAQLELLPRPLVPHSQPNRALEKPFIT